MNSQICKCCGQPVAEAGDTLLRNPNVCVACTNVEEFMPESGPSELPAASLAEEEKGGDGDSKAFAM